MAKTFSYKTRIYYEDTDAGGIVYYANYLKYFERARTECIYSLGFDHNKLDKSDTLIVVRSCNMTTRNQLNLKKKLKLYQNSQSIACENQPNSICASKKETRVKANVELAVVDRTGKPKKMPEDLYKSFKSCI